MNRVFAWPVGRDSHNERISLMALAIGGLIGGLIVGSMIGVVSLLVPSGDVSLLTALAVVSAAAAGFELHGTMGPFPERRRQLRAQRLGKIDRVGAAGLYGFGLGVGFNTWLNHAGAYAIVVGLMVAGSFELAVITGAAYGLIRGAIPTAFALSARTETTARELEMLIRFKLPRFMRYVIAGTGVAVCLDTLYRLASM